MLFHNLMFCIFFAKFESPKFSEEISVPHVLLFSVLDLLLFLQDSSQTFSVSFTETLFSIASTCVTTCKEGWYEVLFYIQFK